MATRKRTKRKASPRRTGKYDDIFVANKDDTFTCGPCLTESERKTLGDPEVEVWEVGGDGWMNPIVCKRCKMSIPVVVNGEEKYQD